MRLLFFLGLGVLAGCAHTAKATGGPAKSVRLLAETLERETTQRTEVRADLEVETTDFDRTPRVVATGETPLLTADGSDAFLFGDEGATTGFAVDNCILLEVLSADGKPLRSVVIGSIPGLSQGKERIDSLGPSAFRFAPGEVQLTSILPESGTYKLRATVLDYVGDARGRRRRLAGEVTSRGGRSPASGSLVNMPIAMQLAGAPQPYTFDVREFLRLVELGTFRGQHVQLVNGVIVRMSPASAFQHSTVWKLDDLLRTVFGRRAMVRAQMAFAVGARSRPEPDIAVVPPADYDEDDPDQAWLIVEVADSSLPFDRTEKSALYASAGVPEYWIVDLADRQVEVRTKPAQGRYTRSQLFGSGDWIPVPRSTRRLRVSDFLSARRPS